MVVGSGLLGASGTISAGAASAASYQPGVVIVGYAPARVAAAADVPGSAADDVQGKVVHVPRGVSMAAELRRLRGKHGVAYAVPEYLARIAGTQPPEWLSN